MTTSHLPPRNFAAKSPDQIREELIGFPPACIAAVLRYRADGETDALLPALVPAMIAFHLPAGAKRPTGGITNSLRLQADLGLDSLALSEMAFKLDDLFGVAIELKEVAGIQTVGDVQVFLKNRLDAA